MGLDLIAAECVGAAPWRNVIIEGDNYDALRHLRMAFAGQVKCILIDPPYNTGKKDFVYNDSFVDVNNSWRYSTWIDFLYQRLVIARDLLREDGVLLCCINDENRSKLEMLMDKVMPGKRIGSFVWRTKDSANDAGGNMSQVHEHILVYGNPSFSFAGKALALDDYTNFDLEANDYWTPQPITCNKSLIQRDNLYYPIQDPDTGYWYPCDPDAVWRYATEAKLRPGQVLRTETIESLIGRRKISFPNCKAREVLRFDTREALIEAIRTGRGPVLPKKKKPLLREDLPDLDFWIGKPIAPGRPSRKDYLKTKTKLVAPISSWIAGEKENADFLYDDHDGEMELLRSGRGGEGGDALIAILGKKVFDHPKPPSLIYGLVKQATGPGDLVMDFFAGSGTTAQAVLQLNREDGEEGCRRFVLVSSTEATEAEPDKNVCRDVCAARVRNVIQGFGTAPALGGDFAYFRTHRIAATDLLDIDHGEVWNALQLIHRDHLFPFEQGSFQWAGDEDFAICYIPRFRKSDVGSLRKQMSKSDSVILYSWQPETLAQHIGDEYVSHMLVSDALTRRFGMNRTLSQS